MPYLEINNLSADYGKMPVLQNIELSVERGDIVAIIGPSGSGKSTLLRVLTGLLKPREGSVAVAEEKLRYDSPKDLRRAREKFAIVFQQFNLFQNMTALRNVTIAPTIVQKRNPAEVEAEARILLEKVGLSHRIDAYPDEMSGGQQQRVAIARALALKPDILHLDEVTSALDPELVSEVLDTIRLLAGEGMTMMIVSHEMGFVREVASKVVFMADGRVVEVGTPEQIFNNPQTQRCTEFVNSILRH